MRCREDVEADVRLLMSKHAALPNRGWTTQRERTELHKRIDVLLDEYAIRSAIDSLSAR